MTGRLLPDVDPAISDLIVGSRASRLRRILRTGATAEHFIHGSVTADYHFDGGAEPILAGTLRHAAQLAEADTTGRMSVRIIEDSAMHPDNGQLTGLQSCLMTERISAAGHPLRTVWLQNAHQIAGFLSSEFAEAPQWREKLGELALPPAASIEYLRDEANRIETAARS